MKYEIVVGLEVHAELNTKTKIYCGCKNSFGSMVNSNCCPICTGMPGTLPTLNKSVVDYAVRMGYALHCSINNICKMDRKNYFYPDLPKAYQISQFDIPLCENGYIDAIVDEEGHTKRIGVTRIHIEEDAGKLIHSDDFAGSLVDFNRCGVPLIEVVSEPDMRSSAEAKAYLDTIKATLQYLGISDCKMQEGSIRCDVNVSVRPEGATEFGTRVEMKNVNSFSATVRAIEYEAARQIEILENGGEIHQETRRWDDNKDASFAMRSKENAQDYRYFPEPDLPPVYIDDAWLERVRAHQPELADAKRARYREEYGLSEHDIGILCQNARLCRLLEAAIAQGASPKEAANWILSEVLRLCKERAVDPYDLELDAGKLALILQLLSEGKIDRAGARNTLEAVFAGDADVEAYIKKEKLAIERDETAVAGAIAQVLAENADAVEKFRAGNEKVMGFLTGQCMKLLRGKADPKQVSAALLEALR